MLIAQISDCHVARPGHRAYGGVDTAGLLRRAVNAINALPKAPDIIVATGDLTQSGLPEEYTSFLEITADLHAPLLPVAGNHDVRGVLMEAFNLKSRFKLQPDFVQYVFEEWPVRIMVLDTVTTGSGQPSFCAARLNWVAARLAENNHPTLIAMHHPPIPAGVAWMEPDNPDWAAKLETLISHHPNVVRVACGHVHRPVVRAWARTIVTTAQSTAYQVLPDLSAEPLRRFNHEAPGFLLHQWSKGALSTFTIATPGLYNAFNSNDGS